MRQAIVAIADADTGAGGFYVLVGNKTGRLVRWGDRGMNERPVVALAFGTTTYRSPGEGDRFRIPATFSAFVAGAAGGLEDRLLDRLVLILTQPAFAARGLNVAPFPRLRRDLATLEEGGQRKDLEMEFWLTR
jgi:hypothetical protein